MVVKFSHGNSKMGDIPSVSLPSGITCRSDCECNKKCYAKRLENLRKTVRESYINNYKVLTSDPDTYWREVEASIMLSRFFRFHVSGDIPDMDYLRQMVLVASKNSHCKILCFTKKYDLVNSFLVTYGRLPNNLNIVFSVWRNLPCDNPFSLPEAHVIYKDGTTTANYNAKICSGNCAECALTDDGCWNLTFGEQVVFKEH